MDTVSINEFFVANLNFTIQDQDVGFGDDGELIGYTEVGSGFFGDDRVEAEHKPLCDTTSLSDDFCSTAETEVVAVAKMFNGDWVNIGGWGEEDGYTLSELYKAHYDHAKKVVEEGGRWFLPPVVVADYKWIRTEDKVSGRWAHTKDAHCSEREEAINLYKRLDTEGRPFGEMEMLGEWRKQRFFKMVSFIDSCNDSSKLRRMQEEVWKRYINSIKSCSVSGDWFAIYLTKRDAREVSDLITAKRASLA